MNKQTFVIILVGLIVAAIVALMWWWFLSRPSPIPTTTGTFGSAQNKPPGGTGGTGTGTNVGSPTTGQGQTTNKPKPGTYTLTTLKGGKVGTYTLTVDPNTGGYVFTPTNGSDSLFGGTYVLNIDGMSVGTYALTPFGLNGGTATSTFVVNPYDTGGSGLVVDQGTTTPDTTPTGGDWLFNPTDASTTPGSVGIGTPLTYNPQAPGTIFSNTNPFNSGSIPSFGSGGGANGGGLGLGGAVIGAVAAGAVACALPALAASIFGSFKLAVSGKATVVAGQTLATANPIYVPVANPSQSLATVGQTVVETGQTIASNLQLSIALSNVIRDDVLNCFARTVAHAALEQIARSTVQWINSGFNGSPSFVTNYEQFFTNVADRAAGEFLQSSSLSFMCSPFKLQVKIAIAASYAHGGYSGQQCTLSKVVNNINGFMNGNFSAGGWPGLMTFMASPNNNPYGAYATGMIGIQSAASGARGRSAFDMSLSGGFLSITQPKNCKNVTGANAPVGQGQQLMRSQDKGPGGDYSYQVCDIKNVTPGTAIAYSLDQTLGINTQSLETAKYFDEIISALVSQLMQNLQTKGLGNLSSGNASNSYVSTNTQVNTTGLIQQSVLQNIPALTTSATQLRGYATQNITSIQASLAKTTNLRNCWANLASASSTGDQFQAKQNVFAVDSTILDLNTKLNENQALVDKANETINQVQNYQSQAQNTTDTAQLQNIMLKLANQVQDNTFAQDTDVVNAQENQIVLSNELHTIDSSVATQLAQCSAGKAAPIPATNTNSLITVPTINTSGGGEGGGN